MSFKVAVFTFLTQKGDNQPAYKRCIVTNLPDNIRRRSIENNLEFFTQ